MSRSTQRLLIATVLVVLGMGVGSVWWSLSRSPHSTDDQGTHSGDEQNKLEHARSQPPGNGAPAEIGSSGPEPGMADIEDIVKEQRQRVSTAEDLLRKGFPAISNPRRAAIEFTAGKSLPELADNLGEISVMELCRNGDVSGPCTMAFWATAVPPNTMVLRLIEEGREDPDRVSDILEKSIAKKIPQLAEIRKKQKNASPGTHYDGYEEALPAQFSIAGAFYVLANIDRLRNPDLLERWTVAPQPVGYETMLIETWFIDHYFRLTDAASSRHAAVHLAIAKNRILAGGKRVFSKWNEPWDRNDRMLVATGVNVKDLKTIKVLSIPLEDPFTFGEFIRIHLNFREHVKQLQSTDGPTPKGP